MQCLNCGNINTDNALYCRECGNNLHISKNRVHNSEVNEIPARSSNEFILSFKKLYLLYEKKIISDTEYEARKKQIIEDLSKVKVVETPEEFLSNIIPLMDDGLFTDIEVRIIKNIMFSQYTSPQHEPDEQNHPHASVCGNKIQSVVKGCLTGEVDIAEKVIDSDEEYECSECGHDVLINEGQCSKCGEPLDWQVAETGIEKGEEYMHDKKINHAATNKAEVVIRRTSEWANKLSSFTVFVDGEVAGKIRDGEVVPFNLNPGEHIIYTKVSWSISDKCKIVLQPGERLMLETGSAITTKKMLNPFSLSPFKETLSKNPGKAIFLRELK